MADPGLSAKSYPTTIGSDAVFKGNVKFDQNVRLMGKFEGALETNGDIMVAKGALLEGEIKASNVFIAGEVRGNTNASGKASLGSSAVIEGDLHVYRLEMAEGAVFNGQCVVGRDRKPGRPSVGPHEASAPSDGADPPGPDDGKKKGLLKQIAGRG